MADIPTFYATGSPQVGSSGFTNYLPSTSGLTAGLQQVFQRLGPDAVVVDGSDDVTSARLAHPEQVAKAAGIQVLARFHSGISGVTTSGIVILAKDLGKFKRAFKQLAEDPEWTSHLRGRVTHTSAPRWITVNITTIAGTQKALVAQGLPQFDLYTVADLARTHGLRTEPEDAQRSGGRTRLMLTPRKAMTMDELDQAVNALAAAIEQARPGLKVLTREVLPGGAAVLVIDAWLA